MTKYLVLIGCESDKTGKRYEPGDVLKGKEFGKQVIENWLNTEPPVLEVIQENEDGSDRNDG